MQYVNYEFCFLTVIVIITKFKFQLMRELGKLLGFEPLPSQTVCTDAPGGRKTLIWTLFKDIEN